MEKFLIVCLFTGRRKDKEYRVEGENENMNINLSKESNKDIPFIGRSLQCN